MYIPLSLAALGILLRGSGFAFRKWASTTAWARRFGAAFAGASVITPFFLGTVAGGVASGRVPLGNAAGDLAQNNGTLQATLNADLLDGGRSPLPDLAQFARTRCPQCDRADARRVRVAGPVCSGSRCRR